MSITDSAQWPISISAIVSTLPRYIGSYRVYAVRHARKIISLNMKHWNDKYFVEGMLRRIDADIVQIFLGMSQY